MEVEVTQNGSKQCEYSADETTEIVDLSSEEKISELREGEENDEEHDGETSDVFCALKRKENINFYFNIISLKILTLEMVDENWVIVLLKEMYLKILNQAKKTQTATALLNWLCQ